MITSNVEYKKALFQKPGEQLNTQQLAYIILHAKRKQKTVTLLDLSNAFRELSHSLTLTVLQFNHIPREIQNIFSEL